MEKQGKAKKYIYTYVYIPLSLSLYIYIYIYMAPSINPVSLLYVLASRRAAWKGFKNLYIYIYIYAGHPLRTSIFCVNLGYAALFLRISQKSKPRKVIATGHPPDIKTCVQTPLGSPGERQRDREIVEGSRFVAFCWSELDFQWMSNGFC